MMRPSDVAALRCPRCREGALAFEGHVEADRLDDGALRCVGCGAGWPVRDGWARLYTPDEVRGADRLMNHIYDRLAPLHDPMVKVALPVCGTGTESQLRRAYLPRLELDSLPADRPVRILEIGVGTGANVPLVLDALGGRTVELWGVDLAKGMARIARRRAARNGWDPLRLALADAHALPFPDAHFDRVFHVGATNNYRDPALALREMARVARPGTPVVVVDERLDPNGRNNLWHRAAFRAVCFYNPWPEDPVAAVPPAARGVRDEQLSRFFYCVTFTA
jgi:ubiquinone/menaquinone biosynthesis C-methylase UbiE